jgi:hypothetical protein
VSARPARLQPAPNRERRARVLRRDRDLARLGLPTEPPALTRARDPAQKAFGFEEAPWQRALLPARQGAVGTEEQVLDGPALALGDAIVPPSAVGVILPTSGALRRCFWATTASWMGVSMQVQHAHSLVGCRVLHLAIGLVFATGLLVGLVRESYGGGCTPDPDNEDTKWSRYKACSKQHDDDRSACQNYPRTTRISEGNAGHLPWSACLKTCNNSNGKTLNKPDLIVSR